MNWETAVFFLSIVLTCLLTGFLSWVAWRHPPLPGVRAYAVLALLECAVSLAEILSMVSPLQEQAQFWFNVRFLFNAFLPVIFFLFAICYNGHGAWISRGVLAGLCVIPAITQVMVWTNPLHHLWVTQEVLFSHIGPFWIASIGSRVPGIWFMVHSFFTIILMLAGILTLLITAWHKRREFLGQSILLSLGAILGLVIMLISSFNLLPLLEYNIFIPGIGLTAVLYAMAILGFKFLKQTPADKEQKMPGAIKTREINSLAIILVIYALVITGIAAIGYFSYHSYAEHITLQVENQLSSIAGLKVDGIVEWRDERTADAETITQNENLASIVGAYFTNPDNLILQRQLQDWLDSIQNAYGYERIYLLDAQGIPKISSPSQGGTVPEHIINEMRSVLLSGKVTWIDFHRHADQTVHLSMIAPIFADRELTLPLGVVVLEINPAQWLFPYLQQWPIASDTAETLLVRADEDGVLFLNPLRFNPDASLNMRFPLSQSTILAVKAVLGIRGIVEGVDYRGEPVVGAILAVPDSPWLLVTRMDKVEINAPLRTRLWQTLAFFGFLILASGSSLGLFWRRNQMRYYQEKLKLAESLGESEEKFRKAFLISPDGIAITRLSDGMVVSTNRGFEDMLGYSSEDAVGKTSLELAIWQDERDRANIVAEIQKKGSVQNYEARFVTKNGETRIGLMSAAIIEFNGETHILNTTRDITERKKAEQVIREYSEKLEEMVEERTRELKSAQERLLRQERLAALGQLAGSIAHELRNPLGVISNAATYLAMVQPEADQKIKEYIEIILGETRTSEQIIAGLLDFTRLQVVERKASTIADIVENSLKRNPPPDSIHLVKEITPDLPLVLVNASQIEQVLGNLLMNAYQSFAAGGEVLVKVECSREPVSQEESVKIGVADNGEGISPENLERIFEPLFSTKAKGIGLGLAICRKLVEANHGQIEVVSELSTGTTFTVYLPLVKESK